MLDVTNTPARLGSLMVVPDFGSENRKRKSSLSESMLPSYTGKWVMKPTTSSSSDDASLVVLEEDENKDEIGIIYRSVADSLLEKTELSEEQHLHVIRSELNDKLANLEESKRNEIRHRLLKHFHSRDKTSRALIGLCRFLNVVLDVSMNNVDLSDWNKDEDGHFDRQILSTLLNRCPNIETLRLYCSASMGEDWPNAVSLCISQLNFLTSLNLYKVPKECQSIAAIIGKHCPQLKCLRIGFTNASLTIDELLSMFYSGDLELLNNAVAAEDPLQKQYHRCIVSPHLMHPFCRTLEEIHINYVDWNAPYVIAFLLRHLPRLQELETSDFEFKDYGESIHALWSIRGETTPPTTSGIHLAKFAGTLALTSLFVEGEVEYINLKSICELCPELRRLQFFETNVKGFTDESIAEIAQDFKKLQKIRLFTCTESDGPLCTTITQAIGPLITFLEMSFDDVSIPQFDFLVDCVNLEVLKLSTEYYPPLKSYFSAEISRKLSPESFLPKLQEVQLDFCMNPLLEELFLMKSTLKHVDVLCLHHLGQTEDQFLELFLQWPQLISFTYKMPRKFTVDLWLKILDHLPNLRFLSLYKDIKSRRSGKFHQLKRVFRKRDIKFDLHLFCDTYLCINKDANDELQSTSDESKTD